MQKVGKPLEMSPIEKIMEQLERTGKACTVFFEDGVLKSRFIYAKKADPFKNDCYVVGVYKVGVKFQDLADDISAAEEAMK